MGIQGPASYDTLPLSMDGCDTHCYKKETSAVFYTNHRHLDKYLHQNSTSNTAHLIHESWDFGETSFHQDTSQQ